MRRQKLILGVCSDPNDAAFLQLLHNWWSNELTESQNPRSKDGKSTKEYLAIEKEGAQYTVATIE